MANKQSGAAAVEIVGTAIAACTPVKYSLARLRRDCRRLYGVSTSTFDGATVGRKPDEVFTVAEMGAIVKNWQEAPVQATKKEVK